MNLSQVTKALFLIILAVFTPLNIYSESYKTYHDDGSLDNLAETDNYIKDNGWYPGKWKVFNENGTLLNQGSYEYLDGKYIYFYSSGEKFIEAYGSKGIAEGAYKIFHKNGNLKSTGSYSKGKREGTWRDYYQDGFLYSKRDYVNGFNHGRVKTYHMNGQLCSNNNFKMGKLDGTANTYYQDGSIKSEMQFVEGKKQGNAAYVNKKGEYIFIASYLDDEVINSKIINPAYNSSNMKHPQGWVRCTSFPEPIYAESPQYPAVALSSGLQGCILLEFKVMKDGSVRNPEVINSQLPRQFYRSAKKTTESFKFNPLIIDGKAREFTSRRSVGYLLSYSPNIDGEVFLNDGCYFYR